MPKWLREKKRNETAVVEVDGEGGSETWASRSAEDLRNYASSSRPGSPSNDGGGSPKSSNYESLRQKSRSVVCPTRLDVMASEKVTPGGCHDKSLGA